MPFPTIPLLIETVPFVAEAFLSAEYAKFPFILPPLYPFGGTCSLITVPPSNFTSPPDTLTFTEYMP